MTDERVAWLHTQIDDDERWALAAKGVRWQWVYNENDQVVNPDPVTQEFLSVTDSDGGEIVTCMDLRSVEDVESAVGTLPAAWPLHGAEEVDPSAAGHIVRHDPARVLRKVEAMRGVLAMYETQLRLRDENAQTLAKMGRSGQWSHPEWGEEFGRLRTFGWELDGRVHALRLVVRELAVEYADRPGYQEMWGPK